MSEAPEERISIPIELLTWMGRTILAIPVLFIWFVQVLLVWAAISPAAGRWAEAGSFSRDSTGGLDFEVSIAKFLALTTISFFTAGFPYLLLPMAEEDRFSWFQGAAFGWIACLVGSVALMLGLENAVSLAIWPPVADRVSFSALLLAPFIIAIAASFVASNNNSTRLTTAVSLVIGALVFAGGAYATAGDGPDLGKRQIALALAAVLAALVIPSLSLPPTLQQKSAAAGLSLLVWMFLGAGFMCFAIQKGWITETADNGGGVFLCLVLTSFLSPVVQWVGSPWAKGKRIAWSACLSIAAGLVTLAASGPHLPRFIAGQGIWGPSSAEKAAAAVKKDSNDENVKSDESSFVHDAGRDDLGRIYSIIDYVYEHYDGFYLYPVAYVPPRIVPSKKKEE